MSERERARESPVLRLASRAGGEGVSDAGAPALPDVEIVKADVARATSPPV